MNLSKLTMNGIRPEHFSIQALEVSGPLRKPLSERLVEAGNTVSDKVVGHRFYSEMMQGMLCPQRFHQFVVQDIHYLRGRVEALSIAQGRFLNHSALFMHLVDGDKVELEKFIELRACIKIKLQEDSINIACSNYVDFQRSVVEEGSLEEFVAILLSCLWSFHKIAITYSDKINLISYTHLYFFYLQAINSYVSIKTIDKLFLFLDLELGSKALIEQEIMIPKIIEVFMCGLQHEINFLDSFYE